METVSSTGVTKIASLRVLVVDDERNIRATLTAGLESLGCRVSAVATASEALAALQGQPFDLAFLDQRLKDMSGLDLIPQILSVSPNLHIIMITAYPTIETAVEAIKRGARDYLPKPFTLEQIRHLLDGLTERLNLSRRVQELEALTQETVPEVILETESPKMQAAMELAVRVAPSEAPVLLLGERGTGKRVQARWLHAQSPRAGSPFIVVNCHTPSENLLASELFGHVKGAFNGATQNRTGRLETAHGGTLLLEEVNEISMGLQAKLLRFLQEKQFERLGENQIRRADVRVVAAANHHLEEEVEAGRFREDLFFALNVVEIHLPPLRERQEDISLLARYFLDFFARQSRRSSQELSPAALKALISYSWPGNLWELRNVLERVVILWPSQVIEPEALPMHIASQVSEVPVLGGDFPLEQIEREHILRVMARKATLDESAHILRIDPSTLWRKRKAYEKEN